MTSRDVILENHTMVVRDGRIFDVLPSAHAADRYAATVHLERSEHLLLPGLVDAYTQICPPPGRPAGPTALRDGAQVSIAQMLRNGTTCFCSVGFYPEESARAAAEQGMRAVIGIPIAAAASPWAGSPAEYLTRALRFRDEFRGHPSIASAFAPHSPCAIPDADFGRIATLADELDAGILMPLHESAAEIAESLEHHGLRPIERMQALGLLTPALTAVHMSHADAADLALAERSGIAITLCPGSNLRAGEVPPIAQWTAAGLRLSLGSGVAAPAISPDPWSELKWLAFLGHAPRAQTAAWTPWSTLAVATRGGAETLGLDAEIGTLEHGKWADLCCIDLRGPAMQWASPGSPHAALTQWVLNGGRDVVSDVWVAGRHLLNEGNFTRIDWPHLAARLRAATDRSSMGEAHADIG